MLLCHDGEFRAFSKKCLVEVYRLNTWKIVLMSSSHVTCRWQAGALQVVLVFGCAGARIPEICADVMCSCACRWQAGAVRLALVFGLAGARAGPRRGARKQRGR